LAEVDMTVTKAVLIILTICIVFGLAAAAYSFI
jgi:FlaG/FlaF family flagellin (archaellin)